MTPDTDRPTPRFGEHVVILPSPRGARHAAYGYVTGIAEDLVTVTLPDGVMRRVHESRVVMCPRVVKEAG